VIYYAPLFFSEFGRDFCVADLETTGLNEEFDQILEFGAIHVRDGQVVREFNQLVKPSLPIIEDIEVNPAFVNGITNEMVKDAPGIREALGNFLKFVDNRLILGHNWIGFDNKWVRANTQFWFGKSFWNRTMDSLILAKKVLPKKVASGKSPCPDPYSETNPTGYRVLDHKLQTLADYFKIDPGDAHRASDDCRTTLKVFIELEKLATPQFADKIQEYYYPKPKEEEVVF
jgi:DNA polymerase III epsilon subunit-like protein